MRIAVIGHVEHVTIQRVEALPRPGEILHLGHSAVIAGGGGGIAFAQLARSPAELHLFTALGTGDAAREVESRIEASGARTHIVHREEPHTRDLVLITPDGERTIVVMGEPLHPRLEDPLPWDLLSGCDAVYFTAQDPAILKEARKAKLLVMTARRAQSLVASAVHADVVVGSLVDPYEASVRGDYPVPPDALVMTDGARGGTVETVDGITHFASEHVAHRIGSYGAGDTFAGAFTWYLARDNPVLDACSAAARHGAAVLRSVNPIEAQLPLD